MVMSEESVVRALQNFSSCDVSDALLKLSYEYDPHGGFLSGLTLWSPRRQEGSTKVIGPAYTVKYVAKDDDTPSPKGHYIDSVPSGSVLFISAPPKTINAVYGGLMSTRAKYLGVAGTIVDGRIRDLQEHRDLDYAVFARDVGTTSPQKLLRVAEVNAPVKLQNEDQEVTIYPGDYLIADLNGVVRLPEYLAERAIELLASQVTADERIADDMKQGRGFLDASREHRASVKMP